jgi:deoxyadenosine/deoxycytidine kinase
MPLPRYIAIEGNIGAGKTTLAQLLASRLDTRLVLEEFADNTFLAKFYADPARWAFPLELSFLADRYKQLKEFLAAPELFAQPIVSDYLFVKSKLFARVNLEEAEYELFARVFEVMDLHLPQPDALLYLHAPVDILQTHIRERGRSYEQDISEGYLQRISSIYESYLVTLCLPVVMIDSACFDFRRQADAFEALLALLSAPLAPGMHYFGGLQGP